VPTPISVQARYAASRLPRTRHMQDTTAMRSSLAALPLADRVGFVVPDWGRATAAMVTAGDEFAPDPRAARAYQKINKVYAGLTAFTDPLFRAMADGLQDLERT